MAGRLERRRHADRVFVHLRAQSRPRSTYEILGALRDQGVTAATTVYRALDKLLAPGRLHRIVSLNAWIACPDPRHAEAPVFEICEGCGAVTEHLDARLSHDIAALSERTRVTPDHSVIEIHGRSSACHANAPTA